MQYRFPFHHLIALLVGALFTVANVHAGQAEQQTPEEQIGQQQGSQEEEARYGGLDPDEVDAFIRAFPRIRKLEREFADALRELDDPERGADLLQEALLRGRKEVLEKEGLDSETYRAIQGTMVRNELLREHVESRIEDRS
jgi:hypothetical protein